MSKSLKAISRKMRLSTLSIRLCYPSPSFPAGPFGISKNSQGGSLVNVKSRIRKSSALLLVSACLLSVVAATPASAQRKKRQKEAQTETKKKEQSQPSGNANRFTSADGGKTVHDNVLLVTWLLDANLGKGECKNVPKVGSGGGMDWDTAKACIAHLNQGSGYLGHTNWQMPATPQSDSSCGAKGTHGNSFGKDCSDSAYGSLFYKAWQLHFGDTIAQQAGPVKDRFRNLQPTMYWFGNSLKPQGAKKKPYEGYNSFSFSNGWQDTNVDAHVMYVLPVMPGALGTPDCDKKNVPTVSDPGAQLTWLADANFAAAPATRQHLGVAGITSAGTMSQQTAQAFVKAMKDKGYPCAADWQLPTASATNCSGSKTGHVGYNCNVSAMGQLYYDVFKLKAGATVAEPPDIPAVKPFLNVQPSLYWACTAAKKTSSGPQAENRCGPKPEAPGPAGFGFSFDMGSGFTDTTIIPADLYLMVYYPDPPPPSVKCSTPACRCVDAGGTWVKASARASKSRRHRGTTRSSAFGPTALRRVTL